MLSLELLVLTLTALTAPVLAHRDYNNVHARRFGLTPRDYITPETRLESYDYIIAGGGLAGLVLASKLSADGETTVLVLEAGGTGDEQRETIDRPGLTYFRSLLNTEHDYAYKTTPQDGAGGRIMNWPRGKILGGSSAVNGMYLVRPNALEVNAMHEMNADNDAKEYADAWTWDSLLEAMKQGETFTPPTQEALDVAGMRFNPDSHGSSGPLQATYSAYMVPISSAWLPTLEAAGVPISNDAYSGDNVGGFFSIMAINPSNWTRSYAKSAYIDNLPPRSNLHILTNSAVTRILFADNAQDGLQVASGVEFASDANDTPKTVLANKEVILAGGAVGSPHMLLVSGVGDRALLESLDIPVRVDLPGVGHHMQDHLAVSVAWSTEEDTQGTIFESGSEFSQSPEFLSFVNSGTSYVNGRFLFDGQEQFDAYLQGLRDTFSSADDLAPLLPGTSDEVDEGYRTIYQTLVDKVYPEAGLVEMLYSINAAGRIIVQAAIQTPLSQGRLSINSTSIFDPPVVDPKYFSHPGDIVLMRQGVKQVRRMSTLSPLRDILGDELSPGPDVQSDEDIENWIRQNANTEFHPGCTCVMLPRDKGGVIDQSLKVHGTANLRVIDGSIFPLSMSAHLMAPIYGVAEKAAELILNPPSSSGGGSGGKGGSSGGKGGSGKNDEDDDESAAAGLSSSLFITVAGSLFTALLSAF
ncbi:mala s 12 allergen [Coprinopsis cinerea okayama7|uniref:pyranose dehydrogenase (acceptor) n=1 Tax=Coprinopsis cinerea (strain Okayama-7 / 130 / ATCC MYA-4618 / FGSC 9003) TaxID=240176 RepID=A8PDT1_COPC7|nr:mala s 12 allergen [Coprinopsis cinerea okayama7\|eukprot:XP_001840660.1 mala s 12 allergen [Coprinopsis cinerea okayama7\